MICDITSQPNSNRFVFLIRIWASHCCCIFSLDFLRPIPQVIHNIWAWLCSSQNHLKIHKNLCYFIKSTARSFLMQLRFWYGLCWFILIVLIPFREGSLALRLKSVWQILINSVIWWFDSITMTFTFMIIKFTRSTRTLVIFQWESVRTELTKLIQTHAFC